MVDCERERQNASNFIERLKNSHRCIIGDQHQSDENLNSIQFKNGPMHLLIILVSRYNFFLSPMMQQFGSKEACQSYRYYPSRIDSPIFKINNVKLEKYKQMFRKLSTKRKTSDLFFKMEDCQIKEQLLKQQLEFEHGKNLSIVDQKTQKWFEPHQRIGPYRNNFKKTLAQLQKALKNQSGNLCLSYNKYTPEQIMALFHSLRQADDEQNIVKLGSLYTSWGRLKNIVHYLSFKKFTHLKIINIGGNFIESVELLCRVDMPTVQDVYLWNNNITDIRSLKRCDWPCLRTLDLHVNKIADLHDLRFLGNSKISTVIFDSNFLNNFNEAIVMCSRSPKSKIAATSNFLVKWMGRPRIRFRKRAIEVRTCTMKVRYI